ncbi:OLC1v1011307C1 [Oldenlandia corymbosa var. corymbosa]|uniref:Small ribosomal subunit protein mS38 n=1 Tax=Oldenlandia corymbosa var. corymbosa TaxID=529605 RepID=A0AAV1DTE2_OLDCO|nr:OLC1v1011307C1 [Oldenlandia corymbosa var. corymbosa]
MGSSIVHKLLRTQSQSTAARIIPFINKSFLGPPPLTSPAPESSASTTHHLPISQTSGLQFPVLPSPENGDPTPIQCLNSKYFPCFSFEFFLNPNPSIGLVDKIDMDGAVSSETPTIWADSVKKKRKRKMNKHKLRKLRKRNAKKT